MAEGGHEMDNLNQPVKERNDGKDEAETSFGCTGLSVIQTQFRNSVVDDFYKQSSFEPDCKDYNDFEYKDDNNFFIKDGERIKLYNAKGRGKVLSLYTLKTHHGINFIKIDLGITEYATISKEARKNLQSTVNSIDEINVESTPLED